MAKKRGNNNRKRKRNGGRIFRAIFTFIVVAGAIIGSLTVFLKVSKIEVNGSTYYTAQQIIETSEIKLGDDLFGVNKFDAIEKIKSTYPYIEDVKIRRRLPDTFVFEIIERRPCGYIQETDCRWLIDSKGILLERLEMNSIPAGAQIEAGEPLLAPFPGGEASWENATKKEILVMLMGEFANHNLSDKITKIDVSAMYSLEFVYEGRITVVLGNVEKITQKINMFEAVLPNIGAAERGKLNITNPAEARFVPESTPER